MNTLMDLGTPEDPDEEEGELNQSSIVNGLYKLLIARQRLPGKHERAARLFAKGRRRVQGDLDIVN